MLCLGSLGLAVAFGVVLRLGSLGLAAILGVVIARIGYLKRLALLDGLGRHEEVQHDGHDGPCRRRCRRRSCGR